MRCEFSLIPGTRQLIVYLVEKVSHSSIRMRTARSFHIGSGMRYGQVMAYADEARHLNHTVVLALRGLHRLHPGSYIALHDCFTFGRHSNRREFSTQTGSSSAALHLAKHQLDRL